MDTKQNQPDAAIDKTLAALNAATPPEGLEARIAARLQQQPAPTLPWHDRLIGYTLPAAWWRGAVTGAAFALLAVTAVLLLQHKTPSPNQIAVTTNAPTPADLPVKVAGTPATPCASPAVFHQRTPTAPATETASTSHPISSGPLTTQERELLRLAQTADPKVLATFNSEHQAQLEAENAAQFKDFFTPAPRPPAPPDTPAANPQPDPANPEASPQATPSPVPEPAPAPNN
jgi:hypothetical protein